MRFLCSLAFIARWRPIHTFNDVDDCVESHRLGDCELAVLQVVGFEVCLGWIWIYSLIQQPDTGYKPQVPHVTSPPVSLRDREMFISWNCEPFFLQSLLLAAKKFYSNFIRPLNFFPPQNRMKHVYMYSQSFHKDKVYPHIDLLLLLCGQRLFKSLNIQTFL